MERVTGAAGARAGPTGSGLTGCTLLCTDLGEEVVRRLVMIMTGTLVLAGCGGGDDFADEDPGGHAACESMQTVIDQYGEPEVMESLLETGQLAREAETPEIRAGRSRDNRPCTQTRAVQTHGFGVPLGWSLRVWSRPLQLRAVR